MGAQNALYKTVAPGPSKKGPPHLFTILHAFYIGFMCSPSHFFIFPTTSHHDLAHNLHLFYVHPFSFFVISHHISSRSCTHFTFVLCAPLRIFLYFLLLLFLFCSCGCSCFSYKAPFFPSHRKARCLSRLLEYFQVKNLTFFNWSFTLCPSFFLCSIWPLDQDQDQDQDLKGGRIASQKGAGFIYRTLGSESRFWLSERFLGPIWLTVFGDSIFLEL